MKALLRNWAFWLFVVVYAASILVLIATGRPVEDAIATFVILGVILPLIALATCRGLPEPGAPSPNRPGEPALLIGLLVFIAAFLTVKGPILSFLLPQNPDPRLQEVVNTTLKLVAFVGIPALVIRLHQQKWPTAGKRTAPATRLWICFVVLSLAVLAVQFLLGSQVKRLFGPETTNRNVWLGLILCFGWMAVEAGVVEEFFFRWLMQSRIAALTGSQITAIFLVALFFGLAHAPGMWLRGAGEVEGLGPSPSLLVSVAYSVATQGVAGIMFGVLWARTRSFPLVVFLHAMVDAPANAARFIDIWKL
jgi:CAAX protease family protein